MCLVSQYRVLGSLLACARLTLQDLKKAPTLASTASDMEALLETRTPLIAPLSGPLQGQMSGQTLLAYQYRAYPSLLEQLVGPPLSVGPESLLGYVTAECALSALRHGELQAALSALFLTTLCASALEEPAIEALHHLLVESDAQDAIGLFELGGWRTGTQGTELLALRRRQGMRFVATATQILGTFGAPERA